MSKAFRFAVCAALSVAATLWGQSVPVQAAAGLSNPAAEHCVMSGGLYGVREIGAGQYGVCVLETGEVVDAWEYLRDHLNDAAKAEDTGLVNPAAAYCVGRGGTYSIETSQCRLADGSQVDAWALLRDAHRASATLANPAAAYCLEAGGAYNIRQTDSGQTGICSLPDGREIDAWTLFRENN